MKFRKSSRLLTEFEFTRVFSSAHKSGERLKNIRNLGPYTIYTATNPDGARLGLSISKRVVRRAHDRNRIKRCLREFFRIHRHQMTGDIVIKVQKSPELRSFSELTRPLVDLIKKTVEK